MTYVIFDDTGDDAGHNAGRGCHSAVRCRGALLLRLGFQNFRKLSIYLVLVRHVIVKVTLQYDVGRELLRFQFTYSFPDIEQGSHD
jgi:hypothetical protein